MEQMITTKTKEQLLEMVYEQRVYINKLEVDLEKERAQIEAVIEHILPIAREIAETKGLMRVFKITKLSIVLVDKIVKLANELKRDNNENRETK